MSTSTLWTPRKSGVRPTYRFGTLRTARDGSLFISPAANTGIQLRISEMEPGQVRYADFYCTVIGERRVIHLDPRRIVADRRTVGLEPGLNPGEISLVALDEASMKIWGTEEGYPQYTLPDARRCAAGFSFVPFAQGIGYNVVAACAPALFVPGAEAKMPNWQIDESLVLAPLACEKMRT